MVEQSETVFSSSRNVKSLELCLKGVSRAALRGLSSKPSEANPAPQFNRPPGPSCPRFEGLGRPWSALVGLGRPRVADATSRFVSQGMWLTHRTPWVVVVVVVVNGKYRGEARSYTNMPDHAKSPAEKPKSRPMWVLRYLGGFLTSTPVKCRSFPVSDHQ